MRKFSWVILSVAIFVACRTQEFANKGDTLQSFSDCAYLGTFSSVSVIKSKRSAEFNDTLTAFADYIYDSVIKAKVKHIKPLNVASSLTNEGLTGLTNEIMRCALVFDRKRSVDSILPEAVVQNVSDMTDTRYTSFFINYGNIWSKKQQRRYVAGQALMVTAVVVGIAIVATALVVAGSSYNPGPVFSDTIASSGDTDEKTVDAGMTCYYMIYDKKMRKFCYIRTANFRSDKTDNNTFNPNRVSEQMDILFGNKIKTIRNS